jgi:excinuclease UvrABC helicase subunit UvrB
MCHLLSRPNLVTASARTAEEIEEMIEIFKQNEVLWRVSHCDYY